MTTCPVWSWTVNKRSNAEVVLDAAARGPQHFVFDRDTGEVQQTIVDPDDYCEWQVHGVVDFDASREHGHAVVELTDVVRL